MIVSLSDFEIPPYVIPFTTDNQGGILLFLEQEERALLTDLLGFTFCKNVLKQWAALPAAWESRPVGYAVGDRVTFDSTIFESNTNGNTSQPPSLAWTQLPENKYLKLRDGADYDYSVYKYRWHGMKAGIVPYLHAMYLKKYRTIGERSVLNAVLSHTEKHSPNEAFIQSYNAAVNVFTTRFFSHDIEDTLFGYLYANHAQFNNEPGVSAGGVFLNHLLMQKEFFPTPVNSFDL